MEFKELRERSGMSVAELSKYFKIPYRTVQNWEYGQRECPKYLIELMAYKLGKEFTHFTPDITHFTPDK